MSNEEKLLKDRIVHLLAHKRYSIAKLADTESKRIMLRRQINGEAVVPFSTLYLLLETFHDISADWLILGEGSMVKAEHVGSHIHNHNDYDVHNNYAGGSINVGAQTIPYPVQQLLEEKDARIRELESDKNMLKDVVASLTANYKTK